MCQKKVAVFGKAFIQLLNKNMNSNVVITKLRHNYNKANMSGNETAKWCHFLRPISVLK